MGTKKKGPSKKQIGQAVKVGAGVLAWILEVTPSGPVGKTIAGVLKEVVPRVVGWFDKPISQVKDDALYRTLRPRLRSRILLDVEREKRARKK